VKNDLIVYQKGNKMYYQQRSKFGFLDNFKRFYMTYSLIFLMTIITLARYVIFFLLGEDIIFYMGLRPSDIIAGRYVWTAITSIFIHADFFHLIANMIALYFIGRYVENILGPELYLFSFIITGISGNLLTVGVSYLLKDFNMFMIYTRIHIGSSGSILGLFAILVQYRPKIRLIAFLFVPPYIILPIMAQAGTILIIQILLDIFFGFLSLPFDFISHFSHVGGMLLGIILYRYWLWKKIYERVHGVLFVK